VDGEGKNVSMCSSVSKLRTENYFGGQNGYECFLRLWRFSWRVAFYNRVVFRRDTTSFCIYPCFWFRIMGITGIGPMDKDLKIVEGDFGG